MSSPDLGALEAALGHCFADRALLETALVHRSVLGRADEARQSNERLEFLGDRVLSLVMAELLWRQFPDEPEGALARRHAVLVQRQALARVAETVGLGDHVSLSEAESAAGGGSNPAILADACEAVIAALYLDGGLAAAERFIESRWAPLVAEDPEPPKDPKTALQEWAQARGLALPDYQVAATEGPAHAPLFTVTVAVDGHPPAQADGASKRAAERDAAEALLSRLQVA